MKEEKERNELE